MGKRLVLWMILLLTAYLPPEFALAADAPAPAAAAQAQAIPQRGTLYRVSYQDHTAWLFGTIHVGKPEFFPLEPQAMQALNDADVLAMEVDMRNAASVQAATLKYGLYPNSGTVDKHVSAATLARLKKALASLGLPYDGLVHCKAWMIADLMLVASIEKQGYRSTQSTESFLLNTASDRGKTITGLESADFQLSLFNKLTEKQQEQYLVDSIDDLESGEVAKKTQDLLDAWASADEKAYDALLLETKNDKTVSGRFFYRELLSRRNPMMADKIARLLKENKDSFVGIGLLHLVGAEGVPRLLEKKGFTVTRLY